MSNWAPCWPGCRSPSSRLLQTAGHVVARPARRRSPALPFPTAEPLSAHGSTRPRLSAIGRSPAAGAHARERSGSAGRSPDSARGRFRAREFRGQPGRGRDFARAGSLEADGSAGGVVRRRRGPPQGRCDGGISGGGGSSPSATPCVVVLLITRCMSMSCARPEPVGRRALVRHGRAPIRHGLWAR